jgi:hypothetical protein
MAQAPLPQQQQQDWNNVTPEQGVVVSGGAPAPGYAPPPVYPAPAPMYYPAPAYYPYAAPYVYPPVSLSLGFGYYHGWGGGHWH